MYAVPRINHFSEGTEESHSKYWGKKSEQISEVVCLISYIKCNLKHFSVRLSQYSM